MALLRGIPALPGGVGGYYGVSVTVHRFIIAEEFGGMWVCGEVFRRGFCHRAAVGGRAVICGKRFITEFGERGYHLRQLWG